MSLSDFLSPHNLTSFSQWYDAHETNLTYLAWNPSDDYSTLTLELVSENDTVIDNVTYSVTGDLKAFYLRLESEERQADEEPQYTATFSDSTNEAWPTIVSDGAEPAGLQKRACGS